MPSGDKGVDDQDSHESRDLEVTGLGRSIVRNTTYCWDVRNLRYSILLTNFNPKPLQVTVLDSSGPRRIPTHFCKVGSIEYSSFKACA